MSERDGYAPGVPCWIDTWREDALAAVGFYTELFGWDAEASGRHHTCRIRGRDVAGIGERAAGAPPAWTTYVWVDSAEETAAKAAEAGGSVLAAPSGSLDGGWMAILADPAGATIGVWQPGSHRGAQLVNEPGAWAMSTLTTADPEGAQRFYGGVFGWETEAFGPVTLWRLPGYIGGEPKQPVPRDVIAVMAPGDGPARWDVNFWVADTDGVADKTAALGGRIVAPPSDAPGFREAVLADPHGAVFSVSQLVK